MKERLCAYCKFTIPYDALVCGHCGNEAYERESQRWCSKHKLSYAVKERVRDKVTFDECPNCSAEKKKRKEAERKSLQPAITKIKRLEKEKQLLNDTIYKKKGLCEPDSVIVFDPGLLFILLFIVCPVLSWIIGAIIGGGFVVVYVVLCILFVVPSFTQHLSLRKQIAAKQKELEAARSEFKETERKLREVM